MKKEILNHYLEPEEACKTKLIQQFGWVGENFLYCIVQKQLLVSVHLIYYDNKYFYQNNCGDFACIPGFLIRVRITSSIVMYVSRK